MADLRCSKCGEPNPEGLETCQNCGASLLPPPASTPLDSQPIHAGEKPTKKATSEFEKVKLAGVGPIHAGEQPTPKDTGELERALPSWLQSLRKGGKEASAESPADTSPDLDLPAEPQSSQPAEASGESLDWLAGLGSAATEDEEEVPDWLAGLHLEPDILPAPPEASLPSQAGKVPPEEEQPPAAATVSSRGESLPGWLESLKPKPAVEEPPAGEEKPPEWLSGLPGTPEEPSPAAPSVEPDWLSKLKGKAVAPEETPPPSASGAEVPDWLSGLETEVGAAASSVFSSELPPKQESSAEVPDWLAQLKSDIKAASEAEKHAEEFEQAAEMPPVGKKEELPDWLAGVERPTTPAAGAPALVMSDEGASSAEPGQAAFSLETPDWLSKLRPDRGTESPPLVPQEEEVEPENLETAELPSWVQAMRPVEAVIAEAQPAAPDEVGAAEGSGPLAGLRGVLPAGQGLGSMRKPPVYAIKLQVTDNQQRYAAQLEKMILEEGQVKGRKRARSTSTMAWRLVISIVLFAAILIPLVTGQQFTPDLEGYPSEWANTGVLLNQFPTDAPMLMVFDYDPAFSGELAASAATVIDRVLFLGTRLTLVSTIPTGPALAEQFLESTQAYHLDTGLQYTNLGYLAGGPAGVLSFATDPIATAQLTVNGDPAWETPALQGITRLSDFAALIILTDNAETGRTWIEQTHSSIGNTPILMIISAQAEPMIRPYYDSGQIQGLVTGLVGGKAYEKNYATPGLARRYWDSFGLGTLVAVVMIASGCAWGLLTAWRTRKKAGEEA
ncbi:MAG: hypothetical protein AB1531_03170 [Chloroflexota bacterium]